jgi:hypothetical protein
MFNHLQPRSTEELLTQWQQDFIVDIKIIDSE